MDGFWAWMGFQVGVEGPFDYVWDCVLEMTNYNVNNCCQL